MTTLEELERRIEALEEGGEDTVPNYLTIDPTTGLVGANFTGLINALGLILPAGTTATPPTASRIIWQRTSDGAQVANIYAYEPAAGTDTLHLEANLATAGHTRLVEVVAGAAELAVQDNPLAGAPQSVSAFAGAASVNIIDSSNNSSFLQLGSQARRRIFFGTFSTAAGSWASGTWAAFSIPHGLGVNPAFAGAQIVSGGSVVAGIPLAMGNTDATNINVFGYNLSAFNLTGGSVFFNWAAII